MNVHRFTYKTLFFIFVIIALPSYSQLEPAAMQLNEYLPLLKNKKVGLIVNHSSLVNNTHLLDTLLAHKIEVKKIFAPEHGFRGKADAGEKINNEIDSKTGLPVISLYGKNKKPSSEQINDLDILIFDIQDVGARFYTFISTMHYAMEACAENNKQLIVLDRPNPNGFYVDGPVLDLKYKSFVGMHPIPVVHGLTVGELAKMINGETWIEKPCDLTVIKCKNYTHSSRYDLPVKPSPNLPNARSINLYPSLCFFEATEVSVGRGTEFPFQQIGSPFHPDKSYSFTPISTEGAKHPLHENKICYGIKPEQEETTLNLSYLIHFYTKSPNGESFFTSKDFMNKLSGTKDLYEQIISGKTEDEIRASWQPKLDEYKALRKKYLLYPDFE